MHIRQALVALSLALVAACDLTGTAETAEPCRELFSAARCLAMTDQAAANLQVTREEVALVEVLPEPTPETRNGQQILNNRSGGPPIDVRVTLTDGSIRFTSMNCVGIAPGYVPACQDQPTLAANSALEGYHDVPCAGEPPAGCATPLPSLDPAAVADAVALRIDRLDIPIAHVGSHEVRLGEARLPNGLLSEAAFALVDDWPPGVSIIEGGVAVRVRSLEPDGQPFQNLYEHGWRSGAERVAAFLVFDVAHFDPGAVLSIRDVVVR